MVSSGFLSLLFFCLFLFTPIESSHWATTDLIGGHKIFFVAPKNTKLNWWNAQKLCRQKGLELASIESESESTAVRNLFRELYGAEYVYHWTSGSNRGRPRHMFAWFSNGRPVEAYANWAPYEPNNAGWDEDFIHLFSGEKNAWNDESEYKEMSVLCEWDMTSRLPKIGGKPSYFIEATDSLNWYEAARACRQRGMMLASIESGSEANKLTAFGFTGTKIFWTSGTSNGQPSKSFYWFSTGKPISFTALGDVQLYDENEKCLAAVVSITTGAASWHDAFCSKKHMFVCETRL